MSTAVETPAAANFGEQLRQQTTGCRLTINQLSTRLKMDKPHLQRVADLFSADPKSLSGSRKVISRKIDTVAAVFRLLGEVRHYVNQRTVPYPEVHGMRLVKTANIDKMVAYVNTRREELGGLLADLDADWESVKAEARERLQELYSEADYCTQPSMWFGVYISFPAIEPDRRLMQLNPEVYAAEQARIAAQFESAVKQAEAAAAATLQQLLTQFLERLKPGEDGEKKTLRASTLDKLREFSSVFAETSIGSNAELEAIVAQVEALSSGVEIGELRKAGPEERGEVAESLSSVLSSLDQLIEAMPVRQIDLD